jgi:anti-sigma B factor antagonist
MFNVELTTAERGGHAVIALHGELDLADAPSVTSHLMTAVAAWGPSIIVDLADLTFIDCCGLGILLRVLQWTRKCGGNMPLAAPQQRVRKVLSVTGLMDVFSVYPSVDQAAAGLGLAPLVAAVR